MVEPTHAALLVRIEAVKESVDEIKEDLVAIRSRLGEVEKFNAIVDGMSRGGKWLLGTIIALVGAGLAIAAFFSKG